MLPFQYLVWEYTRQALIDQSAAAMGALNATDSEDGTRFVFADKVILVPHPRPVEVDPWDYWEAHGCRV